MSAYLESIPVVMSELHSSLSSSAKGEPCIEISPILDPLLGQKLSLIARVEHRSYPIGSALCSAADEGYVDVLRYFIEESKVNPNACSVFGETPIFTAAKSNQLEALKYLLSVGDASLPDHSGRTPLMTAAEEGHVDACVLLAPHAHHQVTRNDWTALMFAAHRDHFACIPILASCCRLSMRDKDGNDALSLAATSHKINAVLALLALNPSPSDASIARAIKITCRYASNTSAVQKALEAEAFRRKERKEIGVVTASPETTASKKPRL